jgi:hypothetical protein
VHLLNIAFENSSDEVLGENVMGVWVFDIAEVILGEGHINSSNEVFWFRIFEQA